MSVGGISKRVGARATQRAAVVANVPYVAVSGLPGGVRRAWAKALAAEREGVSPWAHSDLWRDLRQHAAHLPPNPWEEAPANATATTLDDQDIADLAAAASAGEAVRGRHPNVSSTVIGRVADRLIERHPGLRVLVLYQSPWEAFEEACRLHRLRGADASLAWLSYWLRYHQDALSARERAPGRILLVNAGRLATRAPLLVELLEEEGIAVGRDAPPMPSGQGAGAAPLAMLAAQMVDRGGEYWDTYEALESSAVLLGREPEFRNTYARTESHGLAPVLGLWSSALAAGEVQVENDLLQKQLQHLQGELGQYMRANEAMREALGRSTDVAHQARTLISELLRESTED